MTSTNTCPNCGYLNQDDARFCGQCRADLPPPQADRPILWFFVGVIGAILLATIALFLIRPDFLFGTAPQPETQAMTTVTPTPWPRAAEMPDEPVISNQVVVEEAAVAAEPVEAEQIDTSISEEIRVEEAAEVPVASFTPFPPTITLTPMPTLTPTPTSTMTETPPPTSPVRRPSGQNERISSIDGMIQLQVDEGNFLMGAGPNDIDANSDSGPQREIYLDSFWIDLTEVTNAQFALFLNNNGGHLGTCLGNNCMKSKEQQQLSHISSAGSFYTVEPGYEDHPVIMVTWYGASAYCQWAGRRLPTEAEWEKASRGENGRRFPWGDIFEGHEANFCDLSCEAGYRDSNYDDGFTFTAPVGSYPSGASPYGALDMAGNVTEYVADWHDDQFNAAIRASNPQGPATGSLKVRRGSAWISTAIELPTSFQSKSTPDSLNNNVGFRCAQSD